MKRFRCVRPITMLVLLALLATLVPLPMRADDANRVYLPLAFRAETVKVAKETRVLSTEAAGRLGSISRDGGVYDFVDPTPELLALAPGEVIVAGVSDLAPQGLLRRIVDVALTDDGLRIWTEEAALDEAIVRGSLHAAQHLEPAALEHSLYAPGVTLAPAPAIDGHESFVYEFRDVVLYDLDGDPQTTADRVTADGRVALDVGYDLQMTLDQALRDLDLALDLDGRSDLTVRSNVDQPLLHLEHEIVRHYFAPLTVLIGPVPVVITPVLVVKVGLDGSVHAGVSAGVTQETVLSARLRYDGEWHPEHTLDTQFVFVPPTLSAGLDLQASAGPRLELLLYGVAGAFLDVCPYLQLQADPGAVPWWALYGGLRVVIGIRVEIWSRKLIDYHVALVDRRVLLAQAEDT